VLERQSPEPGATDCQNMNHASTKVGYVYPVQVIEMTPPCFAHLVQLLRSSMPLIDREPISLEGEFRLWMFDVSHGLMLFRRNPTEDHKRAEVLFSDVRAIEIAAWCDTIRIEPIPSAGAPQAFEHVPAVREPGLIFFKIVSKDWQGFVWAGSAAWIIDDGKIGDPSGLYKPGPLMKRLAAAGYLLD
jgi:hypothetical protein